MALSDWPRLSYRRRTIRRATVSTAACYKNQWYFHSTFPGHADTISRQPLRARQSFTAVALSLRARPCVSPFFHVSESQNVIEVLGKPLLPFFDFQAHASPQRATTAPMGMTHSASTMGLGDKKTKCWNSDIDHLLSNGATCFLIFKQSSFKIPAFTSICCSCYAFVITKFRATMPNETRFSDQKGAGGKQTEIQTICSFFSQEGVLISTSISPWMDAYESPFHLHVFIEP